MIETKGIHIMQTEKIAYQASCADDVDQDSLPVAEALRRVLSAIHPIADYEKLALRDALGRILAEDIISPLNVPAHNNSAMDGVALASVELPSSQDRVLEMIGTAYAGVPFNGECRTGQCVRIMTGALMPPGTDTVIMQEHIEFLSLDKLRIGIAHRPGQNVRMVGEDIRQGATVLQTGRTIVPADLGVLASLGIGEIRVHRRPRVAFFSSGDELRSIGESLAEGEIYDSNRYTLYGMLNRLGVEVLDLGVVRDDPEALRKAFQHASSMADVVITSGGVSVGEADYIKPVLSELGEINFWKIAMKPGRPLTFGQLDKALFFGLPGNPVAVMVTFYQFVLPALHHLASGKIKQPLTLKATCTAPLYNRPGRFEFQRGILKQIGDGEFTVGKSGQQGSGILTSMSHANCFILLAEDCATVQAGDSVLVQPFETFV